MRLMQPRLKKNIFSLVRKMVFLTVLFVSASFFLPNVLPASGSESGQGGALITNSPHAVITKPIDGSKLIVLKGNTRPEANSRNDRGPVADGFLMKHILLQFRRSPEQAKALEQFIAGLYDPSSPNFHKWLTAAEFGETFGLAHQDVDKITGWLRSQGFEVNRVYPNEMLVDFSGTAKDIRDAFHTGIHYLDVKGVTHISNMEDPEIPAALAPAIAGIVSLNDFRPHTMFRKKSEYTFSDHNGTWNAVVPADLATIYNITPLFQSGISGQGQTVAVIEDTDVYSTTDWSKFRYTFGLSRYTSGSFTQVHPDCSDPGVNLDDIEAILDAEWASAASPSAAIVLASCANSVTTWGGQLALENLVNGSSPPGIISLSYGECEPLMGAAANASFEAIYEQAAAEGISVFVSSGDSAAAACDADISSDPYYATLGISVSGMASTPYNVAVGGTDYGDTYAGDNSTYWSSTNDSSYGSALSYIPEIPWNDSCASTLIANYLGYDATYGADSFCNSNTGVLYQNIIGGGGGPSGCSAGAPSFLGLVSGTCGGYAKPSWQQSIVGNPGDGLRDLPDVSLFAANGVWGHYYVICYSDPSGGGKPCVGAPSGWPGAGGTSFSAPIMAGIQALINQNAGERQGNPNPVYYGLAAAEYGQNGNSECDSTLGKNTAASCIFYDVTHGDMDVPCETGTYDCYGPPYTWGALSTSTDTFQMAYGTDTGWDFATGIGTVNAYNLVNNWLTSSVINGVCGPSNGQTLPAAPTDGLCSVGTASTVSGSGPWTWSCMGSNGGTTANCLAFSTASPASKIGVFRGGEWYLDYNGDGQWDAGDEETSFGGSGDIPATGDWNGDGKDKIGVFRDGNWYLDYNGDGIWDAGDEEISFGESGDIPVTGDWNGDGKDKIGVFRDGSWYLDYNGNGIWDGCLVDKCYTFGLASDIPVAGDWNGDGKDKIGVFRNGVWYLDEDGSGTWNAGDLTAFFGMTGDAPVVGDWSGSGTSKIGVKRGTTWYIDTDGSYTWNSGDGSYTFGTATDRPVAGLW